MNSRKTIRQDEIWKITASRGEVAVDELAGQFGVSSMTVRRDLASLARAGRLNRVHGGALACRSGVIEFSFRQQGSLMAAEKRAIAREVAALVRPNTAVSLDTGTTTLEVARAITGVEHLTVLTTSLAIASVLCARDGIELVLLGGTVRKTSPDLSGPVTEENLGKFRVHLAVLGADAVGPTGAFTTDVGISRVSGAMIGSADHTVLAVDSSKFGKTAFVRFAGFPEIDTVVTDDGCSEEVRRWLEKSAGRVIYASVPAADKGGLYE